MRRRSGVVSVGIALLTILSCRALFPGDETPAPGSPEAIPGFTRVTRGARALYENPSWSPDGQRIVYTRTEWGLPDPDPTTSEIYMMDLLTGGTRQLTWNSRARLVAGRVAHRLRAGRGVASRLGKGLADDHRIGRL